MNLIVMMVVGVMVVFEKVMVMVVVADSGCDIIDGNGS